ncbi:MAG: hypothetical protein WBF33_36650, partial [Candidatus Nitrosopolaris sp.]
GAAANSTITAAIAIALGAIVLCLVEIIRFLVISTFLDYKYNSQIGRVYILGYHLWDLSFNRTNLLFSSII